MSIYKDCDIRGIYETEITAAECYKIGRALATLAPGKILVGGDVRLSTPELKDALLNLIGNVAMFIPLVIVWPAVFPQLDRHWKVITAGIGVSLTIEILQLPFFGRSSDIDDLILNSAGYLIGYGIWLLCHRPAKR